MSVESVIHAFDDLPGMATFSRTEFDNDTWLGKINAPSGLPGKKWRTGHHVTDTQRIGENALKEQKTHSEVLKVSENRQDVQPVGFARRAEFSAGRYCSLETLDLRRVQALLIWSFTPLKAHKGAFSLLQPEARS